MGGVVRMQAPYAAYRPGSSKAHAAMKLVPSICDDRNLPVRNVRPTGSWHTDPYKCWEKMVGGRAAAVRMEIEKQESRVRELNLHLSQATDRNDYARRYEETMARRLLHEDFNAKMALMRAPQVRQNWVEEENLRLKYEARTLTPLAASFHDWRIDEYNQMPPYLFNRDACEAERLAVQQAELQHRAAAVHLQ